MSMKETGSRQTAKEGLKEEQNGFVLFIDQNKDLFDRHTSSTHELRDEEEGWKNSPTIDQIAAGYLFLSVSINARDGLGNRQLNRRLKDFRVFVYQLIFNSDSGGSNLIERQTSSALSSLKTSSVQRAAIAELKGSITEFRESFREARAPLAAEVEESKAKLLPNFKNYLLSDPDRILVFRDFLLDNKYAASREIIRPFLVSFTQSEDRLAKDNKVGILGEAVKKWSVELSEKPTPAFLDEFAAAIKSPSVLEWLEFAAQGEDVAHFLKGGPDVSTYPRELRDALSSFVASKYYTARSSIEKELGGFRRSPALKSSQQISFNPEGKRKRERVPVEAGVKKESDDEKETSETAENGRHPVGTLTRELNSSFNVRILTEGELIDYLQKEASSFAASDLRMLRDLENIFISLQKDPYGLGTKKLASQSITVGHRILPLRSMNPNRRIGLTLEHPESPRIRIVYVYEKGDPSSIGIEGIYKHESYDRKFG